MNMSSKQDRQGARTVTDLERKYNFGQTFAEVIGIATDAQQAAETAASGVDGLDEKLDQDEIFKRLTNNGQLQGIYRGEDGEIYINASYIVSGIIKSPDGESLVIDLENGSATLTGTIKTQEETIEDGSKVMSRMTPVGVEVVSTQYDEFAQQTHILATAFIGVEGTRSFVTGLTTPINNGDAVNKAYVDALEARIAALEAAIATS